MNTTLTIGGEDFSFDVLDLDFMEKYAPAEQDFLKSSLGDKDDDDIALMRKPIDAGYRFLDALWGDGTAERVYGGKRSLDLVFSTYVDMVALANEQKTVFEEKANVLSTKLSELTD
jgi:hypothetical protein